MAFLADIIKELVDNETPLTSALLKTKVLAHKLDNKQLGIWVNNELTGYENDVPEYRKLKCQVVGTFTDGYVKYTDSPVPIGNLDKKIQDSLQNAILKNSVSNIEDFLNEPQNPKMVFNIPPELCRSLSAYVGYNIFVATKKIDRTQLVQIITIVKTKLLDFLMEIKNEIGDIEFMDDKKYDNEKVDKIFSASIVGDGNVFLMGDNNIQNAKLTIDKGDIEKLKEIFLNAGLSNKDVGELEEAIKADHPDIEKKSFGSKVVNWIGKMINKSVEGSWKIGTGAAGSLLAEAIKRYYGF